MTLLEAESLYNLAMTKAAGAAAKGRFDKAAGYLSAAAIYWRRLSELKSAVEAMKGTKQ